MWNSYYHYFILCGAAPTSIRISLASLQGQPVLSGQLAIPQGWPFNTGLTVYLPKRKKPSSVETHSVVLYIG